MHVLIAHMFFDIRGGGELLALNLAKALQESGYKITIYTLKKPPSSTLDLLGINPSMFRIVVDRVGGLELLYELSKGRFVRLRRLIGFSKFAEKYLKMFSNHIIIDTQSNVPAAADISYIHYPAVYGTRAGKTIYWRLYNWFVEKYARGLLSKYGYSAVALANSTWTAAQTYRAYGIIPIVVYPPVDVDYFSVVSSNDRREKIVVTVSRFTVEKKLERIVDAAAHLRDYTFYIVGSTYKYSDRVIASIEEKAKRYRLDNIVVETNMPRTALRKLLGEARYYLHPEFAEHFGIAVVEAMAAGLIPIVYRDGGAWYDVVSRIHDMLGYKAIEEAAEIVRKIDRDRNLYEKLRRRSIEESKRYNYQSFKKKITEIVDYVARVKRIAKT